MSSSKERLTDTTPTAGFSQTDLQRIFRAAKAAGCTDTIDLRTTAVTVHPYALAEPQVTRLGLGNDLAKSALAEEPDIFEAWRRQNEERNKFAPRHQLRANQSRVLHVLQSLPDGLPVDSIPGAAEKTMVLLAKLGLVESSVNGTSGDRIWRLSQYGIEELEREKIYLNWEFR